MIIRRYFLTELLKVLTAVTLVLLLIALSNRLVILLSRAAYGDMSLSMVFGVLMYHIPDLLAFLLPLSLFLSLLLVLGRWYTDREITALQACGMPWRTLVVPVANVAAMLSLFVAYLTFCVIPWIHIQKEKLLRQEETLTLLQTLSPEHFHAFQSGQKVIYVEKMLNHTLEKVFIAEKTPTGNWRILTAQSVAPLKQGEDIYFTLQNGVRYDGEPGQKNYTRIAFGQYAQWIDNRPKDVPLLHRVTPTKTLWHGSTLGAKAELEWRFSIPLTTMILAFLAIPLAYTTPRTGRYARIFPSIVLYILYYNVLTMNRRWIEAGIMPLSFGVWWVHGALILFAVWLWSKT